MRLDLPAGLVKGISELDPHQREALLTEGNLVIVAGPGSGKTRTVAARAGYLLSGPISPLRGLAAITYTNQAAAELREGLTRLGLAQPQRLFAGTLHSFCLSQVLQYAPLVGVEMPGLDALMTEAEVKALQQECADDEGANFWALREVFPSLRRRLAAGEDVTDERDEHVRAVRRYERKCEESQIWDFEGIVLAAVRLLRGHPEIADVVRARFPIVTIDEYQDLGAALHKLVVTLLEAGVKITAVGDVDQSIYGFAGGAPEYLDALCARKDFTVVRLVTNYRCGSAVVAAAELALDEARGWRADPNREDPGTLEFQVVDGHVDQQARQAAEAVHAFVAAGVPLHETAVLLRNRLPLAPRIARCLADGGVAVRVEGSATSPTTELGRWLEAAALYVVRHTGATGGIQSPATSCGELLDRLERLRETAGLPRDRRPLPTRLASLHGTLIGTEPHLEYAVLGWFQRVEAALGLRAMSTSIGDPRTKKELDALASAPDDLLLAELASDTAGTGRVVLSTYHGAKGRTFTAVVLPGLAEGVVPPWGGPKWDRRPLRGERYEEERRNFYVALTRSRGSVLLQVAPSGIDSFGQTIRRGYSSFAMQLAAALGIVIDDS